MPSITWKRGILVPIRAFDMYLSDFFLAFWGMKLWLSLVLEPGVVESGFWRFCQWCWSKKRRFRPDETAEYTKNCWPLKSACGLTARDLKNHPEIRRLRDASRVRTNKTCLEMGGALQVDTSGFPGRLIEAALKPVTVLPQACYKRSGKKTRRTWQVHNHFSRESLPKTYIHQEN